MAAIPRPRRSPNRAETIHPGPAESFENHQPMTLPPPRMPTPEEAAAETYAERVARYIVLFVHAGNSVGASVEMAEFCAAPLLEE